MPSLDRCHNAYDFERASRRRLPRPLFDYIAGGADDESTLAENAAAFERYRLVPDVLRDVRQLHTARTVMGCDLALPVILAPTGMSRMFHPDGEIAVSREASSAGMGYALSTMASASIEEVAAGSPGPKIYQLYLLNDDGLNRASIDRAKAAGYRAICLTVDTIAAGNRERDLRSGLTVPPRLNVRSLVDFALRPRWCLAYLRAGRFTLPNVSGGEGQGEAALSTLTEFFAAKMERFISWDRVARLAEHWGGPFALKGVQSAADVALAIDHGVSAAIVSNHGGRQLDGAAAPLDLLPDLADAFGDRIELIVDGGVRRGSHVLKALAMGAAAVQIGRPYVHALAAFGRPGVTRLLAMLRAEIERDMALLGCASIDQLGRGHVRRADALPRFLDAPDDRPVVATRKWNRS